MTLIPESPQGPHSLRQLTLTHGKRRFNAERETPVSSKTTRGGLPDPDGRRPPSPSVRVRLRARSDSEAGQMPPGTILRAFPLRRPFVPRVLRCGYSAL